MSTLLGKLSLRCKRGLQVPFTTLASTAVITVNASPLASLLLSSSNVEAPAASASASALSSLSDRLRESRGAFPGCGPAVQLPWEKHRSGDEGTTVPWLVVRGSASSSNGVGGRKGTSLRDEIWQLEMLENAIKKLEHLGVGERERGPHVDTCNEVMNALAEGGLFQQGRALLSRMAMAGVSPDARTFGILIKAYNRAGKVREAERVLEEMRGRGLVLDEVAYTAVMDAMANVGDVAQARRVMSDMCRQGCRPNRYTYSVLLKACCRAGKVEEAEGVLREMVAEGLRPNVVMLSQLLSAVFQHGDPARVAPLLSEARRAGLDLDVAAYKTLIRGYANAGMWEELEAVVELMKGARVSPGLHAFHAALFNLCQAGRMGSARRLLSSLQSSPHSPPSTWTYNLVVKGYAMAEMGREAEALLEEMIRCGPQPNARTYNTVIEALCTERRFAEARTVMERMREAGSQPDVQGYTVLLRGYARAGLWAEAESAVEEMHLSGISPNHDVRCALVDACMGAWQWRKAASYAATTFPEVLSSFGHPGWELDLHGLDVRSSTATVLHGLLCCSKLAPDEVTDLMIITGQGRHSRVKDFSVVRKEVLSLLQHEAGLRAVFKPWNRGIIVVKAGSLRRWFAQGGHTSFFARMDFLSERFVGTHQHCTPSVEQVIGV